MQVGVHDDHDQVCAFDGCTEIDLLPATCSKCKKTFCSAHLLGSSHNCQAMRNAIVVPCPVCHRVVPLEFPGQHVDEAVSRHLDRGCRDPPGTRLAAAAATTNPGLGRTLGHAMGKANKCSVENCTLQGSVHVICDQCKQTYCVEHRAPGRHHCNKRYTSRPLTLAAPAERNASPTRQRCTDPTTILNLLSRPSNTPTTAIGKTTDLPMDMVTPLICFLVPDTTDATKMLTIAPFFLNTTKSTVLGRLLDTAVHQAAMQCAAVTESPTQPWKLYIVPTPVPSDLNANTVPPARLSTVVGQSTLVCSKRAIVFVSQLPVLPKEAVEAAAVVVNQPLHTATDSDSTLECCNFM